MKADYHSAHSAMQRNIMLSNKITYRTTTIENDQKVNYVQQGYGDPVVLTHGLAASLHDWDDLLPELSASGYAGYALDLLGHGESEKPADPHQYTVEITFDHFEKWINSLQRTEPLILIGHSLGGGLSLMYALRHPERVRALVLVNPFYDIIQLPPMMQKVFHHQLINTHLIDRTPYRLFRFLVDVSSFNFYIGNRESHVLPEHIRYQTALDYKRASSGIYNIPRTLHGLTLRHAQGGARDLSLITQPTLLLWGGRDQTLAPSSFPKLKSLLPNVKGMHEFPICGHVPHQCHSQDFNPYVMEFLRNL
jgi:pimeloyl-ACP methyl ester carboxylesterase